MKYQIGAFLAIKVIDLILSTCKVRIYGLDALIHTLKKKPALFALWHNRLALLPYALGPYINYSEKVMAAISKSSDGEWLEAIMDRYPHTESIRIAHNQRQKAFKDLQEAIKQGRTLLIITPDGPRGPCYKIKPGLLVTAKETQCPILSFTWNGPYWEIDSWDKFRIPKPFSHIDIHFSDPLILSNTSSLKEVKEIVEKNLSNSFGQRVQSGSDQRF